MYKCTKCITKIDKTKIDSADYLDLVYVDVQFDRM